MGLFLDPGQNPVRLLRPHLAPGQALADALTSGFLLFYLVWLLVGGISGAMYAIQYNQKNYSSWAPPLAPIKIIMCIDITLMLLQVVAVFFRDVANARGKPLE